MTREAGSGPPGSNSTEGPENPPHSTRQANPSWDSKTRKHGRASNKGANTGRVERTRLDFAQAVEQWRNENSADADRIPLRSVVGQPLPDNTKPPNTSYARECSGAYMEHETGFEPATLTLAT